MASAMPLGPASMITLSNNQLIPHIGFGVYEISGKKCYDAVYAALTAGYRLIDSAEWYGNERQTGEAILQFMKDTNTPRSQIFYTTKLMVNRGYEHAQKTIKKSLELCGLDYIDLYLIHAPYPNRAHRLASWKAMTEAVSQGLIKSLGVSNYAERHLDELLETNPRIKPVINQIDLHPFMTREKLVGGSFL
jgi:diketogulonate reductase-like aldo/keto reductase